MISDLEILKSDKDSMNIGLGNIISQLQNIYYVQKLFLGMGTNDIAFNCTVILKLKIFYIEVQH